MTWSFTRFTSLLLCHHTPYFFYMSWRFFTLSLFAYAEPWQSSSTNILMQIRTRWRSSKVPKSSASNYRLPIHIHEWFPFPDHNLFPIIVYLFCITPARHWSLPSTNQLRLSISSIWFSMILYGFIWPPPSFNKSMMDWWMGCFPLTHSLSITFE